jgi:beta-lactamase class D
MIVCSSTASASEWQDSSKLEAIFAANNVTGTFVLYDTDADIFIGYNQERAETRFIPASTYKIPNTLIGIITGAVKSVDEVFPYDGKPQPVKSWEKDMGLREAIKVSNVPVYQELARRIGLERMRAELARLGYGNGEIGDVVDVFWLEGPLAISPVEQTLFLARLAHGKLPLPEKTQMQAQELLLMEQNDDWSLFAKTGTAARLSPNIGWWVGWVETEGKIYTFALNIELPQKADTLNRIGLGKQCLAALGVIR